jgi:hypothetical protein
VLHRSSKSSAVLVCVPVTACFHWHLLQTCIPEACVFQSSACVNAVCSQPHLLRIPRWVVRRVLLLTGAVQRQSCTTSVQVEVQTWCRHYSHALHPVVRQAWAFDLHA